MEQNNSSDLLLVIDMQNVYTKGQEWACKGIKILSKTVEKNIIRCDNVSVLVY